MLNKIREMSNRILKLTYKMVVPNKEAEEKIKQAVSGKGEHGLTRDQCEDLGIPYKEVYFTLVHIKNLLGFEDLESLRVNFVIMVTLLP